MHRTHTRRSGHSSGVEDGQYALHVLAAHRAQLAHRWLGGAGGAHRQVAAGRQHLGARRIQAHNAVAERRRRLLLRGLLLLLCRWHARQWRRAVLLLALQQPAQDGCWQGDRGLVCHRATAAAVLLPALPAFPALSAGISRVSSRWQRATSLRSRASCSRIKPALVLASTSAPAATSAAAAAAAASEGLLPLKASHSFVHFWPWGG